MGRRRKTGRQRSAAVWGSLVTGFASSGLTLEDYCAREGICRASFYRWRALLGGAATGVSVAPAAESAFVDLGTLATPSSRLELRLDLGGGVILHIARG